MDAASHSTPPTAAPRRAETRWSRREALAVAALVALALGLRVAHVLGSQASPFFDAPQMDALYHLEWARAFAAGEAFQPPPFFRAPLYPWLLGAQLALFGDGLLLPRLVQCALGALATLLVFLTARRAFGRPAATLAGLAWATNWVAIFYDGELLLETLAVPLYLLGTWLTLGLARRPAAHRAAIAGVAWGLAAITRPNVLLLMPLLALWLALRERSRGLRALVAPACLAAGVLLPILPISAYNLGAGGDRVLIASQAGVNLWIGNNPRSDGSTAVVPGTRQDWWGGYHDAIAMAEAAESRALRPSEVSRHYTRRALAFAREHPLAWLRLMGHKLRLFLYNAELGNNEVPRFLFERFSPLAPLSALGFGILLPLAAVGLVVTWRGAWARLPLWGFVACYSASVVLFFVNARFRLPVLPFLSIYAGAAIVWGLRAARSRRWRALSGAACLAAALALVSYAVPPSVLERERSSGHLMLGGAALLDGDLHTAIDELDRAVAIRADNGIAWRALGLARRRLGDVEGAERALLEALRVWPDDADALDALADLLLAEGRARQALPYAVRLDAAAPFSSRGPYARGRTLLALGALEPAAEAFEESLRRGEGHFSAAYGLGLARLGLGSTRAAAEAFERALAGEPPEEPGFLLDAYRRCVEALLALGEPERARAVWERMRTDFADHPVTRELGARM